MENNSTCLQTSGSLGEGQGYGREYWYLLAELEFHKQKAKQLNDGVTDYLNSGAKELLRWLMTINSGTLLWLISSLDKFSIGGSLFLKYYYVVIVVLQIISASMYYYLNGVLLCLIVHSKLFSIEMASWKEGCNENLEDMLQRAEVVKKVFPKRNTELFAIFILALSLLLLGIYVISFILINK